MNIFTSRQRPLFIKVLPIILAVLLLNSCSDLFPPPEIVVDEPLLTGYNSIANATSNDKVMEEIDCYLDYSYGMGEGMKATAAINTGLKDFLGGRKVTYYKIGLSDVPSAIDINAQEANFIDLNNFREPASKLKVAIDKITANKNKVSIFITDFEKVDDGNLRQNLPGAPNLHPIDASAWAQNNFKEWLQSGNQIDIFARQYQKPDFWFDKGNNYQNWIYTIVFTPHAIIKEENLYKKSVIKFLSDGFTSSSESKHFTYSANNFKIEQGGNDEASGNANENLVVQENITTTKEKGFEYYHFTSADLMNLNADESQKDKRIINKIKLTSQNSSFADIQYGLKVYDVTQSITDYSNSLNQEAPEVTSDLETGEKDTIANKPVAFKYERGEKADDVFDFVYNTDTKEIGIKLKPEFTGTTGNTIYQVDLVVKDSKLKDFSDENNVLKLNYANNYSIKSLGESLKLSMNDIAVSLAGKVLYTIYIKIDK